MTGVPTASKDMYQRAGWTLAFTLIFYFINRAEYPGPALQVSLLLALLSAGFIAAGYGLQWVGTVGQERVRVQVMEAAALGGSERVLEIGGTLGVAAAKKLKSGKVIAIADTDVNEGLREAARREGIVDKVRFEAGDLKKLTYPDSNFDIALSTRALEKLSDEECARAIAEIARVLKPGGRVVLHAVGDSGRYAAALAASFTNSSAVPATLPLGLGGHVFSAQKSAV